MPEVQQPQLREPGRLQPLRHKKTCAWERIQDDTSESAQTRHSKELEREGAFQR